MFYYLGIFCLFFVFSYICFKKPLIGLSLILLTLPLYQIRFFLFVPLTFLEIEILILFFIFLLKKIYKKEKIFLPPKILLTLIILFLLSASVAVFISPDFLKSLGFWKAFFVEPVIVFFLVINLVHSKKDLFFLVKSLCLGAFVASLWAIFQKIFNVGGVWSREFWAGPEIWRATGPFPHPNFLGLYIGPLLLITFSLFFKVKNKQEKIFWLSAFLIGIVSLFLARSEGAILAVFFSCFLFSLFFSKKTKIIALILLFLCLFVFVLDIQNFRSSFLTKLKFEDISGQLRLNIWKGAWKMLKDSPVFGVGLRGYQILAPSYQEKYSQIINGQELISVETHPYPHNLFLSLYLELGILGFLIFLALVSLFFAQSWNFFEKTKDVFALGLIFAMLVVLIHGLVDTPYFKNDLSIIFWTIFSFSLSFIQAYEKEGAK